MKNKVFLVTRDRDNFCIEKKILIMIALSLGIISLVSSSFSQKVPDKLRNIQPQSVQTQLTPRQIVEKVLPSLVVIFAQDKQGKTVSQGSGFVYKPGLIATNLHVFKRASSGFVKAINSEKHYNIVEVVDMDRRNDICIVRIEDRSIPQLPLGDDSKLGVGDEVFAFGNPKGLEGSVSKGIISSIRNNIGLIQIDAAISPGSSGGPIVNQKAEVIGIAVAALMEGQNLNFSVPVKYVLELKERFNFPVSVAGFFSVNDRDNERLKGPVKSYSRVYARYEYDEAADRYVEESQKEIVAMKAFDEYGNLVEEKSYHYGEFVWKYTYSYDGKGFIVRRNYEDYEGKRESWEESIDKVISLNTRDVRLSGIHTAQADTFVYDSLGNLLESSVQTKDGLWHTLYLYDRNGFETESKEYLNEKLSKASRYTYELDQYGNWIKRFRTVYDSRWASLGYVPNSVLYQNITYFE